MAAGRLKNQALAVGSIEEITAQEAKERGFLPPRGTTMSSWTGCSGGMVGIITRDDSTKHLQPQIVGLSRL